MSLNKRIAVYTGVFDPIHLGHFDLIERGCRVFDRLIVGVGNNPDKSPFFNIEERVHLVQKDVEQFENVEVIPFSGLAVRFVREMGAGVMLRGLRTTSDMEYEFNMSLTNLSLDADIETVFLMAKGDYSHLSSSLIRQIASFGGNLESFISPTVKEALEQRAKERQTGNKG